MENEPKNALSLRWSYYYLINLANYLNFCQLIS